MLIALEITLEITFFVLSHQNWSHRLHPRLGVELLPRTVYKLVLVIGWRFGQPAAFWEGEPAQAPLWTSDGAR